LEFQTQSRLQELQTFALYRLLDSILIFRVQEEHQRDQKLLLKLDKFEEGTIEEETIVEGIIEEDTIEEDTIEEGIVEEDTVMEDIIEEAVS